MAKAPHPASFFLRQCPVIGKKNDTRSTPSLSESPHQPTAIQFPKRQFGKKSVVYRPFQPAWFLSMSRLHGTRLYEFGMHICSAANIPAFASDVTIENNL
ncbi:uncharacterized protein LOC134177469 isoform X1 [Corticium candelabrum]|uniref:uncharacterized protein LOC134177469 isoform X1 n=1 Tax=Corticium candelabrum TaxID=121492 RepID=UPI002E25C4D8|nr:uncharacterized protein LOC134177469 isoform X1 [Corticium candelabrum]